MTRPANRIAFAQGILDEVLIERPRRNDPLLDRSVGQAAREPRGYKGVPETCDEMHSIFSISADTDAMSGQPRIHSRVSSSQPDGRLPQLTHELDSLPRFAVSVAEFADRNELAQDFHESNARSETEAHNEIS